MLITAAAVGKPVSDKSNWNQKSKRDLSTEATKVAQLIARLVHLHIDIAGVGVNRA